MEELLFEFGFKNNEINNILKELDGESVDLDEARKLLTFFSEFEILRSKIVRKSISECILKKRAETLYRIKECLENAGLDSARIIENSKNVLVQSAEADIENVLQVAEKVGINAENVLKHNKLRNDVANRMANVVEILKKFDISPKIIENCASIVYNTAIEEIEDILGILQKSKLDYKSIINNCPTILASASVKNIEKMLEFFQDDLSIIENCPSILTNDVENIKKIYRILGENNKKLIEECPSILVSKNPENIISIVKILGDKSYIIASSKTILTVDPIVIEKKVEVLKKFDLLDLLDSAPSLLYRGSAENMEAIIEKFKKEGRLGLLKSCPSIFTKDIEGIEDIDNALEKLGQKDLINDAPNIYATSSAREIVRINSVLRAHKFERIIFQSPSIYKNTASNIEEIINLLGDSAESVLSQAPSVLVNANADNIKGVKEVLGENFESLIKACPSILQKANKENFLEIDKVLGESRELVVKKMPTIYAIGTPKRIKEIRESLTDEMFLDIVHRSPTLLTILDKRFIDFIKTNYGEDAFFTISAKTAVKLKQKMKDVLPKETLTLDAEYEENLRGEPDTENEEDPLK